MRTKTETATVPRLIRWTDDEWTRIARYLFSMKEAVQFTSFNLAEVKAKDVFIAQQVLPEDRRRKLVSIAQGFDGIRTRVGLLLHSFSQAQDDVYQRQQLAYRDKAAKKGTTSNVRGTATGKSTQLLVTVHMNEANVTSRRESQPANAGLATASGSSLRLHRAAQLNSGFGEATAEPTVWSNGTSETREGRSPQSGQLASDQPAPFQGASALMQSARPFIKMACEELARALVGLLFNQEVRRALQTGTLGAASQRAANPEASFNGRQSRVGQPSPKRDEPTQSQDSFADDQRLPSAFSGVIDDDGLDGDEIEVQPLFDPKLPPSADSDFKPNIGVVATEANDLQELRQLYPQLNLTIVQADSVSDVRCFGHCQRIIALCDEMSPVADELLSRLLRHRYVRLGGGISGIKDQLNAWLHSRGSISTSLERAMSRHDREPVGELVKKKQNRYPRIIDR
jgi:hypothetical protein